ncbi:DUF2891 domain-containing protein [Sphingobacterium sp. SGL-16]|uniref:DUF2891 domain-containing protein n=1 Tax=Sphingobacterium sp. SGL-16 TaxID=2710883 RepID=UPI0013EE3E3B|nr:DUF2891 domain-containing protein [Sphingobacterium sp. SGL-16]NGM74654.1 DUF2891 domain-containing protein [Sphingobacterium sp. SGL-16]
MKAQVVSLAALTWVLSFSSCSEKSANSNSSLHTSDTLKKIVLSEAQAKGIFDLPVHCLEVEYPNKLGQVLGSDNDLKSPKQLRPIFYGCFDWHSSVHGYWSIVELMQKYPSLDADEKIRATLNRHITAENVAVELAFFNDTNNKSFERTYGWAWLFKLQESLSKWQDADAQLWKATLQPLVDLLVMRYEEYLPKLVYPIRTGQHDNSAFGLSLSLDYARSVGDKDFENAIIEHGKRLFEKDINCDLAYEPSGYDFLSPCLEEAYLMSKLLGQNEYKTWLEKFMPKLFKADFKLEPAIVKDRSDGKLVHLDGLNYSRAACLYGISNTLAELHHLRVIANNHIEFSLPNLSAQDDYMGSHWLGTFALYALSHGY